MIVKIYNFESSISESAVDNWYSTIVITVGVKYNDFEKQIKSPARPEKIDSRCRSNYTSFTVFFLRQNTILNSSVQKGEAQLHSKRK